VVRHECTLSIVFILLATFRNGARICPH